MLASTAGNSCASRATHYHAEDTRFLRQVWTYFTSTAFAGDPLSAWPVNAGAQHEKVEVLKHEDNYHFLLKEKGFCTSVSPHAIPNTTGRVRWTRRAGYELPWRDGCPPGDPGCAPRMRLRTSRCIPSNRTAGSHRAVDVSGVRTWECLCADAEAGKFLLGSGINCPAPSKCVPSLWLRQLEQLFTSAAKHVTKTDLYQPDVGGLPYVERQGERVLLYMSYRFGLYLDFLIENGTCARGAHSQAQPHTASVVRTLRDGPRAQPYACHACHPSTRSTERMQHTHRSPHTPYSRSPERHTHTHPTCSRNRMSARDGGSTPERTAAHGAGDRRGLGRLRRPRQAQAAAHALPDPRHPNGRAAADVVVPRARPPDREPAAQRDARRRGERALLRRVRCPLRRAAAGQAEVAASLETRKPPCRSASPHKDEPRPTRPCRSASSHTSTSYLYNQPERRPPQLKAPQRAMSDRTPTLLPSPCAPLSAARGRGSSSCCR
jgi:hypothetical protein